MAGIYGWCFYLGKMYKKHIHQWIHFTINPGDLWGFSRLASRNQRMSMAKEKPMGSKPSSSPGKPWFWVGAWLWYQKNVGNIDEMLGKSWAKPRILRFIIMLPVEKSAFWGYCPISDKPKCRPMLSEKGKTTMFFMDAPNSMVC